MSLRQVNPIFGILPILLLSGTVLAQFGPVQSVGTQPEATPAPQAGFKAIYVGVPSVDTLPVFNALKNHASLLQQTSDPASLSSVNNLAVVYLDKPWSDRHGSTGLANSVQQLLRKGVPLVEVLPFYSNSVPFLGQLNVVTVDKPDAIGPAGVTPTYYALGLKVYPETSGITPHDTHYFITSSTDSESVSWVATATLTWASSEQSNLPPSFSTDTLSLAGAKSPALVACERRQTLSSGVVGTLDAGCPSSGIGQTYVKNLATTWNLCTSSAGYLGYLTTNHKLYKVTNAGGSNSFYVWYMYTQEVPGALAPPAGCGSSWEGADEQDYISAGANSAIYIWCYGPYSTTGSSTAGVDVGVSVGDSGASANVGYSYSYSISEAPIADQSNVAHSVNILHWWTNLDETSISGQSTFNSEPAGTFAVPSSNPPSLPYMWSEARWAQPGWCGWLCESFSSYYQIYWPNVTWN